MWSPGAAAMTRGSERRGPARFRGMKRKRGFFFLRVCGQQQPQLTSHQRYSPQ
jgi:hypothetical protein